MTLKVGEIYNGFLLIEETEVKEINSVTRIFSHIKSGAKLFHVENDDDNKVFSISFRTPPKDSTGVAHILEHSVLCGSEKFPLKEPFVELLKGSLNTFLNAFTFGDKTMYPVASRNTKDFFNLMDVYLDAVLHPNIYKYPEIMMQEGWHYQLNSIDDEITYKGVVYNEMKGAFSSPESVLMRKVSESLFPDTPYGVESGGDPEFIPDLTQEDFLDFHRNYYHPSNSYIYLYGDMDIIEALKFIDGGYLKEYTSIEVDSKISIQQAFKEQRRVTVDYPLASNEKEEDKTYFSLNYVIDKSTNAELYMAFSILEEVLLEAPAAPLKKAIIDAKLGKDVFGMYDNSIIQPTFSIIVKNSNESREEEFKKLVEETLQKLAAEGIDKKLIESVINLKEFSLREADYSSYPKGLVYNIMCMDSWLYDESPVIHLRYEAILSKLREGLKTDYFENLIKEYLINNTHSTLLLVKPKKGLSEEKENSLREKLDNYKKSLSKDDIEKIVKDTAKLSERQQLKDSEEDIKKIPLLSLEDIDKQSDILPLEERHPNGDLLLFHDVKTNGIVYFDIYFDSSAVNQNQIPYIKLLSELLSNVRTENYSYEDLSNEVNLNTGGISFHHNIYSENRSEEKFITKFKVKAKAFEGKVPRMLELIREIICFSKFDDKKRIQELISEIKSRYEMKIYSEGHQIAATRVQSYFSPIGNYVESVSGISFYHFICDLDNNFDSKYSEIVESLKQVSKAIFNQNNILFSLTSNQDSYKIVEGNLGKLTCDLSKEFNEKIGYKFKLTSKNEGLITSGKVQYVAKGGNYKKLGFDYSGVLLLFKAIARYDYIWNRVRVQGGAYGCMVSFQKNGNICFSSYRDPNLTETLNIYQEISTYLENFKADKREMTKYIIGTISDLDAPLSPYMKGQVATANYICGIKQQDIQKERDEILTASANDITKLSNMFSQVMKQNNICVLGNEDKIKSNESIFNSLLYVIE